ncbi:MAG: hypothetical protein MZV70_75435 [Desulfobacterales bacterium]|nr:hypothetical protein [Desulfobacterales bacterium]
MIMQVHDELVFERPRGRKGRPHGPREARDGRGREAAGAAESGDCGREELGRGALGGCTATRC